MSANTPEPPPNPVEGPAVWDLVQEDMRERDKLGEAKYGVRLTANDGRNSMVDAYQEVLDLAVYLRKHLEENAQLRARFAEVEAERDRLRAQLDSTNASALAMADEAEKTVKHLMARNEELAAELKRTPR